MKKPLRYDDAVGAFVLCGGGCNQKHRAKTERFQNRYLIRLLQLSAAGEVFLEGTCPLSRCPQTAKFPAPCSGARRRWVRKATAFRGRSEQDRSALCPACCALVLETFRRNVFNGICLDTKTNFCFVEIGGHGSPCPYKQIEPPSVPFRGGEKHSTAVPAGILF